MEYILFIHKNSDSPMPADEWETFFDRARKSGMFDGGSEIGKRVELGKKSGFDVTDRIGGYMRFNAANLEKLKELLSHHPVMCHGGTLELCELPRS